MSKLNPVQMLTGTLKIKLTNIFYKLMLSLMKMYVCLRQFLKVTVLLLARVGETAASEYLQLNKLWNTGLCSWWSNSHSLKERSTSRVVSCCGHLPLSPTHLTSTPAVGQWTCNLVAAGHQPGRRTHTPHPAAAALQATRFAIQPRGLLSFYKCLNSLSLLFSALVPLSVRATLSWWQLFHTGLRITCQQPKYLCWCVVTEDVMGNRQDYQVNDKNDRDL